MRLFCCICDKEINSALVTGKEIYPHRKDLYHLKFYQCDGCGGYVGTHKTTLKPLGHIVSKEIKQARIKIHNLIDPLWKSGKMKRKEIYKKLSDHCGYIFHTADIKNIHDANRIISYCETLIN